MMQRILSHKGQATLSFILLVSGVVLQIAVAGSVVTYFLSSSKFSERLVLRALAAAQAGIRDAQMRIVRDNNYASSGQISYSFDVGNDSVDVVVSRSVDNVNNVYIYTISATGNASFRKRKLVGTVITNQTTGLLQLKSIEEKSI